MQVLYTASATSTGDGRTGHVRSIDGVIDTDLAVPKGMGGPGGALPNPEEQGDFKVACLRGLSASVLAGRGPVGCADRG